MPGEIETLDRLNQLPYEMLVPGHGEVQRDQTYVRQLQGTLRNIREQVALSVKKGMGLEATTRALDTSSFESKYTGGDALRAQLLRAWWIGPIVRSAWLEARGEPIVQSGKSDNR